VKDEPSTEAFHAKMRAHWLAALEVHRREIETEGMTVARKLTLQRLEALVAENTPDSHADAKPQPQQAPQPHSMTKTKTRRELRQEYYDALDRYWTTVSAIPAEDLEAWVRVSLPPPMEPTTESEKKPRKPDEPPIGQHCPRCSMRRFRCVCKPPCESRGRKK
jgi:hypothetical protein